MQSEIPKTLPDSRRIRESAEFERVFRAEKTSNAWFAIYRLENSLGFARVGIAASKRVMPKAVSRNLAKRLIRETFRLEFPTARAMDMVVYPRRRISRENLAEGREALRKLLRMAQQ